MNHISIIIPVRTHNNSEKAESKNIYRIIPELFKELLKELKSYNKNVEVTFKIHTLKNNFGEGLNSELLDLLLTAKGLPVLIHVMPELGDLGMQALQEFASIAKKEKDFILFHGSTKVIDLPGAFSINPIQGNAIDQLMVNHIVDSGYKNVTIIRRDEENTPLSSEIMEALSRMQIKFIDINMSSIYEEEVDTDVFKTGVSKYLSSVTDSDCFLLLMIDENYFVSQVLSKKLQDPRILWASGLTPPPAPFSQHDFKRVTWVNDSEIGREFKHLSFNAKFGTITTREEWRYDLVLLIFKSIQLLKDLAKDKKSFFKSLMDSIRTFNGRDQIFTGLSRSYWFDDKQSIANNFLLLKNYYVGGSGHLTPTQYVNALSGAEKLPVCYTYIDLIKVENIDMHRGTFRSVFYIDIRSLSDVTIEDIEFLNLENSVHAPDITQMFSERDSNEESMFVKRFRVDAEFLFDKNPASYPFDCQTLTIDITCKNPIKSKILISLPPLDKQDGEFECTGWQIIDKIQGRKTDYWKVPSDKDYNFKGHIRHGFSCGWKLKRKSTETILKTIIPITVLLLLSYLFVFASRDLYTETAANLLAAMLASIALYFSVDKPKTTQLTALDKIFISSYIMIGGLLVTVLFAAQLPAPVFPISMKIWKFLYPIIAAFSFLKIFRLVKKGRARVIQHKM